MRNRAVELEAMGVSNNIGHGLIAMHSMLTASQVAGCLMPHRRDKQDITPNFPTPHLTMPSLLFFSLIIFGRFFFRA
jgi:hypothetical protein